MDTVTFWILERYGPSESTFYQVNFNLIVLYNYWPPSGHRHDNMKWPAIFSFPPPPPHFIHSAFPYLSNLRRGVAWHGMTKRWPVPLPCQTMPLLPFPFCLLLVVTLWWWICNPCPRPLSTPRETLLELRKRQYYPCHHVSSWKAEKPKSWGKLRKTSWEKLAEKRWLVVNCDWKPCHTGDNGNWLGGASVHRHELGKRAVRHYCIVRISPVLKILIWFGDVIWCAMVGKMVFVCVGTCHRIVDDGFAVQRQPTMVRSRRCTPIMMVKDQPKWHGLRLLKPDPEIS